MRRILRFIWILIGENVRELLIGILVLACFGIFVQATGAWVYFIIMQELPGFEQSFLAGAVFFMAIGSLLGLIIFLSHVKDSCRRAWRKTK